MDSKNQDKPVICMEEILNNISAFMRPGSQGHLSSFVCDLVSVWGNRRWNLRRPGTFP